MRRLRNTLLLLIAFILLLAGCNSEVKQLIAIEADTSAVQTTVVLSAAKNYMPQQLVVYGKYSDGSKEQLNQGCTVDLRAVINATSVGTYPVYIRTAGGTVLTSASGIWTSFNVNVIADTLVLEGPVLTDKVVIAANDISSWFRQNVKVKSTDGKALTEGSDYSFTSTINQDSSVTYVVTRSDGSVATYTLPAERVTIVRKGNLTISMASLPESVTVTVTPEDTAFGSAKVLSASALSNSDIKEIDENKSFTATIAVTDTSKYDYQITSVTLNGTPIARDESGKISFTIASGENTLAITGAYQKGTVTFSSPSTLEEGITITIKDAEGSVLTTFASGSSSQVFMGEGTYSGFSASLSAAFDTSAYMAKCGDFTVIGGADTSVPLTITTEYVMYVPQVERDILAGMLTEAALEGEGGFLATYMSNAGIYLKGRTPAESETNTPVVAFVQGGGTETTDGIFSLSSDLCTLNVAYTHEGKSFSEAITVAYPIESIEDVAIGNTSADSTVKDADGKIVYDPGLISFTVYYLKNGQKSTSELWTNISFSSEEEINASGMFNIDTAEVTGYTGSAGGSANIYIRELLSPDAAGRKSSLPVAVSIN